MQVFKDVEIGVRLGHGSHGIVYHGLWRGQQVAVKVMPPCPCRLCRGRLDRDRLPCYAALSCCDTYSDWSSREAHPGSVFNAAAACSIGQCASKYHPTQEGAVEPEPAWTPLSIMPLLLTCSQGKRSSVGSAVQVIEVCVASARDEQARDEVPAEVKLALNVDHPNIVRLLQHACRLSRDDCGDGAQVLSHSQSTAVLSGCRAMPMVLCMSQPMLTQPASMVRALAVGSDP